MSYAVDEADPYRRAAVFADKILKRRNGTSRSASPPRCRADRGRLLLDEVRLAATRAGRRRRNAVLAALLS